MEIELNNGNVPPLLIYILIILKAVKEVILHYARSAKRYRTALLKIMYRLNRFDPLPFTVKY
jgi:hypothetical protein